MSSCCPVCYRATEENVTETREIEEFRKNEKLQKRFFELFERYLNEDKINVEVAERNQTRVNVVPSVLAGTRMLSCGQCLELMESFCELFHQLKTTELLIAWKVETLKNVMKCAGKVPSRISNLQDFTRTAKVPEEMEKVISSRRSLIEKCSQKLANSFPKLSIKRLLTEERTIQTLTPQTGQCPETKIIDSVSNEIELVVTPVGPVPIEDAKDKEWDTSDEEGHSGNRLHSPLSAPIILRDQDDNIRDKIQSMETSVAEDNQAIPTLTDREGDDSHNHDKDDQRSTYVSDLGVTDDSVEDMDIESDNHVAPPPPEVYIPVAKSMSEFQRAIKLEPQGTEITSQNGTELPSSSSDALPIQLKSIHDLPAGVTRSYDNMTSQESPTGTISRLRSTHRCQHCGRTFSSNDRLQLHIQDCHNVDDDMLSDNDRNNEIEVNHCESDSDSDSMCLASSSSDEGEDNLERDGHETITAIRLSRATRKSRSGQKKGRDNFRPINRFRLKCPDCCSLFMEIKALLLHRKTSISCRTTYDPSANVKVEVLTIPEGEGAETAIEDSHFIEVYATFDLPHEIYECGSCDMAVYSLEDMEVHKQLHGTFKCHFCDATKSYAPDLALHEKREHFQKRRANGKRNTQDYNCARCGFACKYPNVYLAHFVSNHLSLTFNDPKCAICKTNSESMNTLRPGVNKRIKFQTGIHLKTHHDLNHVSNTDDLKMCKAENCQAYFLTAEQLTEHQKLRHIPKDKLVKHSMIRGHTQSAMQPFYRLKCPDCNSLFYSIGELLIHRKSSDSCSDSYDPLKSVKVDLLVPPDRWNKNLDGNNDSGFTTVHAIIDLPQAIFVCDIDKCGEVQYSSEDMEAHKKLHGTFLCNFCKSEHSSAPKLAVHELKHFKREKGDKSSKTRPCVCPRCDFQCHHRTTYIRHHLSSHLLLTVNEPICPICKTHNLDLSEHASKHARHFKNMHDLSNVTIPEDILRCTVLSCDAYFLSTTQLTEHLWFRHKIGVEHIRNRSRRYQPKDPACDNPSKQIRDGPRKRAQTHKCRDCGKSYTLLRTLWAHRIKHHVDPDKVIPCTVPKCDRVFESKKQLKFHMTHASFLHKSLECPITEKVYVQCPQCNKAVSGEHPNYLAHHMKSHERSFFCELCGKVFKKKPHLEIHLLYHSGPESWKFECSVCSKKCKTQYLLNNHMRTHTKEKPFVCQICGLKYTGRHNLRFHVNSKHADVTEDKARKMDKTNITSTKGIKRKKVENKAPKPESDDDSQW